MISELLVLAEQLASLQTENIVAIFLCRKFVISIVPEWTSAIFKKNALSAYYVTGIRETAVNETDRKKNPCLHGVYKLVERQAINNINE